MSISKSLVYTLHRAVSILVGRDYVINGVLRASRKRVRQFKKHLEVGNRVLEIGTGSGVLSEVAIAKGAREVVAVDINPAAVSIAKKRIPQAQVLESDLFEKVEGVFDTIIFAPPWSDGEIKSPFHHAIYDCGVTSRFLEGAKRFLAQDGHIWMQYSDESKDNFDRLHQSFKRWGYRVISSWSYEDWAILVRRKARILLYKISPDVS